MRHLFLLALLCVGCRSHSEATSSIKAELAGTEEKTRKVDTTEPVAVPQHVVIERWTSPEPVLPTPGGGTLVHMPPGAAPLPRAPRPVVDGPQADSTDPYLYERETIDYGPPLPKVTHEEDASAGTTTASIEGQTEANKGSEPVGIFAFLAGWWKYILLAIPVLLFVFRRQLLAFAVKRGIKLPFLG